MSVEYLIGNLGCNLKCDYCYQTEMRGKEQQLTPNLARVKEVLTKFNTNFSLFGGEPLLAPIDQLQEIFQFGYDKYKTNGVQTNGLLITPEHIELFMKYRVHVGVSIDGHGSLNAPRTTPEQADKVVHTIEKLIQNKIVVSLITTIHKANATPELFEFLNMMEVMGIKSVNAHLLETDSAEVKRKWGLSDDENLDIFVKLYKFSKTSKISLCTFSDIAKLLTEKTPTTNCTWNSCDPLNTRAVQGVRIDGELVNCGRTNQEGIDWLKAEGYRTDRLFALMNTPQELGGCKDCKYFSICKGQCPAMAIGGDWRNRSENCYFWFKLIEYIEQDLGDKVIVRACSDHHFYAKLNQEHGDTPHGDSHGDHGDASPQGVQAQWKN